MGRRPAWLSMALTVALVLLVLAPRAGAGGGSVVVVGEVRGTISGATADYVKELINYAASIDADAVVLLLDTPGGGLEPAFRIADLLSSSPVPVIGFVDGRWAMSAGTIILECTDIAAMKPTALIGAVQPVALSPTGEYRPINESKLLNPVYKKIELCMKINGRNESLARRFVYNNLVLDGEEALRLHAVDLLATSVTQLVLEANGSLVKRLNRPLVIREPVEYVRYRMPPGLLIAQLLADPLVSSLISSIAMLVILLGLASGHPHAIALGIGLLLLGLFGLGLSAGVVAIALMIIGFIFLIVELVAIPGFGLVGLTGILLIVIGAIVAFTGRPVYIAPESLRAAMITIAAVVTPLSILMAVIVFKAVQAWKKTPVYQPSPVGKKGRAIDDIPPGGEGFVMVEGEYWRAINKSNKPIRRGDHVRVIAKEEGGILIVEPAD